MAIKKGVLLASYFIVVSASSGAFDQILEDVKPCQESCITSYPPHTYPGSSDSNACERGCRFYTIGNYVSEGLSENIEDHGNGIEEINVSKVKNLCYGSCVEAYNETSSLTVACKYGCDAQERVSKLEMEKEEEEQSIHSLIPIMQVRAVATSMMGALKVLRTSIITYFIAEDNKIIAMESEPEIIMEVVIPVDEADAQETLPLQARNLDREMIDESGSDPSVVSCFSRRLGMPPYLLVASVMALMCFTIYIICAVFSSAESKNKGLSVQADPIVPMALPVKCVRPEDLTRLSLLEEDDQQAPALPIKVHLPSSNV